MGERGNIKNLWKSFRIFLRQQKKKKKKEEEIIRLNKFKNNCKLTFFISLTAIFHLIYYLIPKREEKITKINVKVQNIKLLNKFDKIKDNINKSNSTEELINCKNELINIDNKIEKKEKEFKSEIKKEIVKVNNKLDEKNNVKKDNSIDLGRIIVPVIVATEEIISKPNEDIKKEEINKDKLNKTKSELSESIKYINKQLELNKEVISIQKKPNKISFFNKLIKDMISTSIITELLFKSTVITVFTNAVILNNNVRSMRKSMGKKVGYININDIDQINTRKKELKIYTNKILSNSLYQINTFKSEIIEKYGNQIEYNDELKNTLKEIDNVTNYINEQKEIINKKTKNMVKK